MDNVPRSFIFFSLMLRMSATETKFFARVGGARCPAYGFSLHFALSFDMNLFFSLCSLGWVEERSIYHAYTLRQCWQHFIQISDH